MAQMLVAQIDGTRSSQKRAQRFVIQMPLSYHVNGEQEWHKGTTQNVSLSGVLFRCEHPVKPDAPIEMRWAVPRAVFGNGGAQVLCQGKVVRATEGANVGDVSLAARISHYRIIRSL